MKLSSSCLLNVHDVLTCFCKCLLLLLLSLIHLLAMVQNDCFREHYQICYRDNCFRSILGAYEMPFDNNVSLTNWEC